MDDDLKQVYLRNGFINKAADDTTIATEVGNPRSQYGVRFSLICSANAVRPNSSSIRYCRLQISARSAAFLQKPESLRQSTSSQSPNSYRVFFCLQIRHWCFVTSGFFVRLTNLTFPVCIFSGYRYCVCRIVVDCIIPLYCRTLAQNVFRTCFKSFPLCTDTMTEKRIRCPKGSSVQQLSLLRLRLHFCISAAKSDLGVFVLILASSRRQRRRPLSATARCTRGVFRQS